MGSQGFAKIFTMPSMLEKSSTFETTSHDSFKQKNRVWKKLKKNFDPTNMSQKSFLPRLCSPAVLLLSVVLGDFRRRDGGNDQTCAGSRWKMISCYYEP